MGSEMCIRDRLKENKCYDLVLRPKDHKVIRSVDMAVAESCFSLGYGHVKVYII